VLRFSPFLPPQAIFITFLLFLAKSAGGPFLFFFSFRMEPADEDFPLLSSCKRPRRKRRQSFLCLSFPSPPSFLDREKGSRDSPLFLSTKRVQWMGTDFDSYIPFFLPPRVKIFCPFLFSSRRRVLKCFSQRCFPPSF